MTTDKPQLPAPADQQVHDTQDTEPVTTAASVDASMAPRIEYYGEGQIVRGPGGRFLPGTTSPSPITRENAQARSQARLAKKRKLIADAANDAVERDDYRARFGDWAFVAEIGAAAQRKATNIEDPKQIDAARFLLQEAGLSEPRQAPTEAQANESVLASFGREGLAALLAEYRRRRDDAGG